MKKSFGTAIKFFGEGWWPNLTTYAKLCLLTYVVLHKPGLMGQFQHGRVDNMMQQVAHDISAQLPASDPPVVQFSAGAAPSPTPRRPGPCSLDGPPPAWPSRQAKDPATLRR